MNVSSSPRLQLGVKNVEAPSSSGSSVLVGLLVSGLLAAIAITVGYCKCQRRPEKNGVKLVSALFLLLR